MTQDEALKLALEALEVANSCIDGYYIPKGKTHLPEIEKSIIAIKEALAEPEQEPVAMKFKIYKPTVPDPMRQGINNALLPWVYDQDRNSGFDATMWVTPVATLPPQRKPLTDEEVNKLVDDEDWYNDPHGFVRAIEAAVWEKQK